MLKPSIFISKLGISTWMAHVSDVKLASPTVDLISKIQNGVCEVILGSLPNQIVVKVFNGYDSKEALAVLFTALYGAVETTQNILTTKSAPMHLANIKNLIKCDTNIEIEVIEKYISKLISVLNQTPLE